MPKIYLTLAALVVVSTTSFVSAQGIVGGAEQGAREGDRAAGPVGGVVGGVVGAVGGGISGLLGIDDQPRFRDYAVREHHAPFTLDRPVIVGEILPAEGVTYYVIPHEYGAQSYRYTIVNDQTVLVDPTTHRIVQVIR